MFKNLSGNILATMLYAGYMHHPGQKSGNRLRGHAFSEHHMPQYATLANLQTPWSQDRRTILHCSAARPLHFSKEMTCWTSTFLKKMKESCRFSPMKKKDCGPPPASSSWRENANSILFGGFLCEPARTGRHWHGQREGITVARTRVLATLAADGAPCTRAFLS